METCLLLVTLASQILVAGSLVASVARPQWRVWPPPSARSWQFLFTWVLTAVSFLGTVGVGAFHWNALAVPIGLRLAIGAPLLVGGVAFSLWGVRTLSVQASLGLRGQLIRSGPYRYSRNPQYVGTLVCVAGWAVLASSLPALAACLGCGLWYLLAPFAEEPWLRNTFGSAYEQYCDAIPRFISWRTLRGRAAA